MSFVVETAEGQSGCVCAHYISHKPPPVTSCPLHGSAWMYWVPVPYVGRHRK